MSRACGARRGAACAALVAAAAASVVFAAGGGHPLVGVALQDDAGRSWTLDELVGTPVLLVVADRSASREATAWGAQLAAASTALAPWRAEGKVAWISIADLRRVPDYAHDAARDRLREREAARPEAERTRSSPLLLDWKGAVAERLAIERGGVTLVLVGPTGAVVMRASGPPTEDAVRRLAAAIDAFGGRSERR